MLRLSMVRFAGGSTTFSETEVPPACQIQHTRQHRPLRIVDGLVLGGHEDFEQLAVVRPADHCVTDAGWLHPARAGDQAMPADAFELRLEPALEAIHHLEAHVVVGLEKYRHSAEITLKLRRGEVVCREEANASRAAIEQAAERLAHPRREPFG